MKAKKETFLETKGADNKINCMRRIREASQRSWGIKYHYHEYIEFLYAVDAECEIWIGGKCQKFLTGDFVVLNSNQPHCIYAVKPSEYICVQFTTDILFGGDDSSLEYNYVFPFLLSSFPKTVFKCGELPGVDKLSEDIMRVWEAKEYTYGLKVRADILFIFSMVLGKLKEEGMIAPAERFGSAMKQALSYIASGFRTVTEREVADACNLSYYHFSHIFRKNMGKPFTEYVNELKITEAQKLLLSTDRSVTEIAMDVGFSSASHFISRFKSYTGTTPYRFKIRSGKPVELYRLPKEQKNN